MSAFDIQASDQKNRREKNAFWMSLITGVLFGIISAISLITTIQTGQFAFSAIYVIAIVSIVAFFSAYLSRKHKSNLGTAVLILTVLIISLSLPLIIKGQGLAMGVTVVLLVSGLATASLEPKWSLRATIAAIVVGITITLIDLYTPIDFGTASDPRLTLPFTALLSFIYAIDIIIRFRNFNLRAKLIVSFILVAVIPLTFLGFQSYQNTYNLLNSETNTSLLNTAALTADSVDSFIQTGLDTIRAEAQVPDLADYLQLSESVQQGSPQEARARRILQAFQRKDPVYISSYSLMNLNGIDILDTYIDDIGIDKADRSYFTEPLNKGLPFVSPVLYSPTTSQASVYFSAPVRAQHGNIVGVLRVRFNAAIFQDLVNKSLKGTLSNRYAVLADSEFNIRLARTNDPSLNFKSFGNLTSAQTLALQKEGRLTAGSYIDVVAPLQATVDGITNIDKNPVFTAPNSGGVNTISAGVRLKNQPTWIVLIREPITTALQPITDQSRTTILLSLLMAGLAVGAALLVAQFLSAPITSLTAVAEKVSAGDLNAQATAFSQDEIGILAKTFNSMTNQLRQTLGGLEQRVQERTAELAAEKEQTEKRARDLEGISEISRAIASEQNLDRLLPLITRMISERFKFYHAGIFLLDDSRAHAVLRAANSAGGQRMLARGHKLEVGRTGLVGYVAEKGRSRIALDVGKDAVFFNNPDLPDTRSEIALPLNLRGKTIGVLDVQSNTTAAFTNADASTLAILAEQVAIAIDNARLFSETQRSLSESQALYRQFVTQAWEKPAGQNAQTGYLYSLSGGKVLDKTVRSAEITQAVVKGEMVVAAAQDNDQAGSPSNIAIPIKLRNQVIGVLNVRSQEKERPWNQDELSMVQAISERIAFALDNARLLEDSQRRAARERSIGEISIEIGKATDIDAILRSTVEELGKKLRNAEVAIQVGNTNEIQG